MSLAGLCLGLALLGALAPACAAPQGDARRGEPLYQLGRRTDGSLLQAERPGLGAVPAQAVACASCHRPSAMGGREGKWRVPAITGRALFASAAGTARRSSGLPLTPLRSQQRSAYTTDTLARALVEGLDPDAHPLAVAMPRYRLSATDVADLEAYLRQRSDEPIPGVAAPRLHLATVVTPQASPQRRAAVSAAMQAWAQRTTLGAWTLDWQLWRLEGGPEQWPAQLQALHRRQPVYALVSGAGGADWAPVDAFCERQHLPCLFPSVDRLPSMPQRHFSVHLSAGVEGEARMLAQHLASRGGRGRVLQVVAGPLGQAAAAACLDALPAQVRATVRTLDSTDPARRAAQQSLGPQDALVVWAPGPEVSRLWEGGSSPGMVPVYVSATLAPPHRLEVPAAWRPRVHWASLKADPGRRAAGATLSQGAWQRSLQLPAGLDEVELADVHAATFFFTDALARMQGSLHPDYLLERLEVAVDRRPAGAGYFRLSLGPGQRVAAQGGHLLGYQPPRYEAVVAEPVFFRAEK